MKSIISLGELSFTMLFPLLIPPVYYFRHLSLKELDNLTSEQHSVFMHNFMINLGYLINGILYFIDKNRSQPTRKTLSIGSYRNQLVIEKNKLRKLRLENTKKIFLLLSIFNYFNFQLYDFLDIVKFKGYQSYYVYSLGISVFFIITAIASHFCLNLMFYRHQKFSMILSILLCLVAFSFLLNYIDNNDFNFSSFILGLSSYIIIRSFRYLLYVWGKKFMLEYYSSHFQLLFAFGIIGITFNLILNGISFFIKINEISDTNTIINRKLFYKNNDGKYRLFNVLDLFKININIIKYCLYFGITVILWFFENLFIWTTINLLSPCHYMIYANISMIAFSVPLKKLFTESKYGIAYYIIIAFIGIIFASLIFNEIIIIRLFGLDKYTVIEICKRERLDMLICRSASGSLESSCSDGADFMRNSTLGKEPIVASE